MLFGTRQNRDVTLQAGGLDTLDMSQAPGPSGVQNPYRASDGILNTLSRASAGITLEQICFCNSSMAHSHERDVADDHSTFFQELGQEA